MAKKEISIDIITGKSVSPELKNLFAQGMEYKNQHRDYAKAITCFQKVIAQEPNFMHPHYLLGLTYIDMQEWEKVIPCFERVNELVDDEGDAYFSIGYAYQQLGKNAEASAAFREADVRKLLDNRKSHLYYYWAIAEKRKAQQDSSPFFTKFQTAISIINKALALEETAQFFLEKANILLAMQCFYDAERIYKMVEKNKNTGAEKVMEAQLGLAFCYIGLDNYDSALKWVKKLVKDNPEMKPIIAQEPAFEKVRQNASAGKELAKLLA